MTSRTSALVSARLEILNMRPLRGPNYWSPRKAIQMRLDLGELEQYPTDKLEGFSERLVSIVPTLEEHRCSERQRGGFLKRMEQGTWLGHVTEHVAIELQCLVGIEVGFGKTRETETPGVYNVIFSYRNEDVGMAAGRMAVDLINAILGGEAYDYEAGLQNLREIREARAFGPSTQSIVDEAERRGIPYLRLNEYSLVQLGHGVNQKRIQATMTNSTGSIAVDVACDKRLCKELLEDAGVPVPRGRAVRRFRDLLKVAERLRPPFVVKPVDGNHGRGVTTNISSREDLERAYDRAKEHSRRVIIEEYVRGGDYRFLVIDGELVAVAHREPAHVIGDCRHSIGELVERANEDPRRGYGHEKVLTYLEINAETERLMLERGIDRDTVLPAEERFDLTTTANLSTGGTAIDVTDQVHTFNRFLAERAARIVGLDIAGIDVIAPNVTDPLTDSGGAIIEVNAAPGFRMHLAPSDGHARNVAKHVVDMLFPPGSSWRVPIVSVTGTNGKTTTTRLIAHLMKNQGRRVGYTSTDGIYIHNRLIMEGDMSGPYSARIVMRDPGVDFAVLETARGGMLREGLAFDECDVAVVTNVAADHLGLRGINTLEDLAFVKSLPVRQVRSDGHAVLNADDPLVADMAQLCDGEVVYFTLDPANHAVKEHVAEGRTAVVYDEGNIVILHGGVRTLVSHVVDIPITMDGRAAFNIANTMAAVASAFVCGAKVNTIRVGLSTFFPSIEQSPGRLTRLSVAGAEVMLDYAHNVAGFQALGDLVRRLDQERKIAVIGGPGDRRDEDLVGMGRAAAGIYTEVILREDRNRRGRDRGETSELVQQGLLEAGFDPARISIIVDEQEAALEALRRADRGDLVVIVSDKIQEVIDLVRDYKKQAESASMV